MFLSNTIASLPSLRLLRRWIHLDHYLALRAARHDPLVRLQRVLEREDGVYDGLQRACEREQLAYPTLPLNSSILRSVYGYGKRPRAVEE